MANTGGFVDGDEGAWSRFCVGGNPAPLFDPNMAVSDGAALLWALRFVGESGKSPTSYGPMATSSISKVRA